MHTYKFVQQDKNRTRTCIYVGVCNGPDISANDSVCLCVYSLCVQMVISVECPGTHILMASPRIAAPISFVTWVFAYVQLGGH